MVELEEMVRRFESERMKHASEILSQGKRLEEFEATNSSLENKLFQRQTLVSKMEQEVDEKENSIAANEREVGDWAQDRLAVNCTVVVVWIKKDGGSLAVYSIIVSH